MGPASQSAPLAHHEYLSVGNYLEEDSDSSLEGEQQQKEGFQALRANLAQHPQAAQRLVVASACLAAVLLLVHALSRGSQHLRPHTSMNPEQHAVRLEAVRDSASFLMKPLEQLRDGLHSGKACAANEEMHLGVCYKKCAVLSNGAFPHRVAAATCCKSQGLGCFNIMNDKTRQDFNVGGGAGDGDPSTPAEAHPPQNSGSSPGAATVSTDLRPQSAEHLPEGKVCAANEELYGGLCYKKCSVLTGMAAATRTSAWTCCKEHPCGLWNEAVSLGTHAICTGYDVSGDGGCPRKPGACRTDEEMHLGICYEKCSDLTGGQYPYRFAPATCCKEHGIGCLNPRNDMTSDQLAVGGIGTDEQHSTTPMQVRAPVENLSQAAEAAQAVEAREAAEAIRAALGQVSK